VEDGDSEGDEMKLSDFVTECDALTSSMEIFTKHLIRCAVVPHCIPTLIPTVVVKMLYHRQVIMKMLMRTSLPQENHKVNSKE